MSRTLNPPLPVDLLPEIVVAAAAAAAVANPMALISNNLIGNTSNNYYHGQFLNYPSIQALLLATASCLALYSPASCM